MLRPLRDVLREMATPSARNEKAYLWALIAAGHALAGAAFFPVLGYWIIPLYAGLKESWDLWRGGDWRDGMVDTFYVSLGVLYGPDWWPAAVFAAVFLGLLIRGR